MSKPKLLEISNLKLHFPTDEGDVRALESVSFSIQEGEIFGLVGESASGKSVTSLTTIGLSTGVIDSGSIKFEGEELLEASEERMREFRGNDISMIFQEPMTALNPLYTVERQIHEVMILHEKLPPTKSTPVERLYRTLRSGVSRITNRISNFFRGKFNFSGNDVLILFSILSLFWLISNHVIFSIFFISFLIISWILSSLNTLDPNHVDVIVDRLRDVRIPNPTAVAKMYPHELSGGMRQRVMIAMMMACEPRLLIADEPTTALDVTIQSQIVELMKDLRNRKGTSILLITHDIGLVAEMCDRVGVMYAGSIVEQGTIEQILNSPRMPYTIGLMHSIPSIGEEKDSLPIIPGQVPDPLNPPSGCKFHPRCPFADSKCISDIPESIDIGNEHYVGCHHLDKTENFDEVQLAFDNLVQHLHSSGVDTLG
jgi:peptide/nickel transport system ATP-binding protein